MTNWHSPYSRNELAVQKWTAMRASVEKEARRLQRTSLRLQNDKRAVHLLADFSERTLRGLQRARFEEEVTRLSLPLHLRHTLSKRAGKNAFRRISAADRYTRYPTPPNNLE